MEQNKELIKEKQCYIHGVSNRCLWNDMIKFIKKTPNYELKNQAKTLLNQYNTAGGKRIKNELELFLIENGC